MVVIVAVSVGVTVVVMGCVMSVRLTGSRAFQLAHGAAVRKTFDVVMMTFLRAAHVLLEAKNLSSVFAEGTVHGGVSPQHLFHPFSKGVHHHRMIAQVTGGEKLNLGMIC